MKFANQTGVFKNINEENITNININDCVEAFVIQKNKDKKNKNEKKDFKVKNVKWNQPHLEEMLFPWLFPIGKGGYDFNDQTNRKFTFNR